MTLEELRRRRHDAAREARGILNAAEARTGTARELTADERSRFDALDNEITDLDRRIRGAQIGGDGDEDGQRSGRGHESYNLLPAAGGAPEGRATLTLGREQRMSDWQHGRNVRSEFSPEEARGFSLGRAVRGMVTGRWDDAEFEQRALAAGADVTGGVLVPEPLAAFVIDRIRAQARVLEAGAQVIPMTSDEMSVPRVASGVQGGWRNENAPVVEANMAFERVRLVARTLAVLVRIPEEMFEDLTPEGSDAITNELTQSLALELDRVALRGSGAQPEPRGIRFQPGVQVQSLGANGATPLNYDWLVDAAAGVMAGNHTPNATIYSSRTAATLAKLKSGDGQPLTRPPLLANLRELVSNQVTGNLAQGTAVDTSEAYTGDFAQVMIGVRPSIGVKVVALRERFADTMQVGLRAHLRADVTVAHGDAFVVTTGIRP